MEHIAASSETSPLKSLSFDEQKKRSQWETREEERLLHQPMLICLVRNNTIIANLLH